jgi:predicted DNA-binding transcriptional regulator YafY
MTIRTDLLSAVSEHRVVELRYQDDAANRVVHPHVVYRTRGGKECVDAYQVAGATQSGDLPDWRPFDLSKIRHLQVLDERFLLAPGYNPSGRKYRNGIIARA